MEYIIDAKNKKFGRLASEIAVILQGKKSAAYNPRFLGEDKVVIQNLKDVVFSGNKMETKIYHHHTGYVGHLKEPTLAEEWARSPERVLRMAVLKMLPKNRLAAKRIKNLKILK
ncbi:MAG: 50S ribosomal protein L13 [Patescibacteria group bacterium]|nr:50S ribosomal protein L13 [Patescibacteria group bacterium]